MSNKAKDGVFTIPNLLSLFRLALIPLFVLLYSKKGAELAGLGILLLSGLTDILDGYIARKFDMISDVGKILDPVADKLTQAVTLICLAERFPMMLLPLTILMVKELSGALLCFMAIRKSGQIQSSLWHGKLNTLLLYVMLALHLIWGGIPYAISLTLISLCSAMMLFSFALYAMGNLTVLARRKNLP